MNNENTKMSFSDKLKDFKSKHTALFSFVWRCVGYVAWFYLGYQVGIQGLIKWLNQLLHIINM